MCLPRLEAVGAQGKALVNWLPLQHLLYVRFMLKCVNDEVSG